MIPNAILQFLRYKWMARGRHGVHSPFVYSFVENVLQNRKKLFDEPEVIDPRFLWLGEKYGKLTSRITSYYSFRDFLFLPDVTSEFTHNYDLILFRAVDPCRWLEALNKNQNLLRKESAVLIPDIHKSLMHSEAWQRLCSHPGVLVSIDLFGIGLLFFREEFREPQHFVLRWQG